MSKASFTISGMQPENIPAAAELADRSFDGDRQTQMKRLGDEKPFDMKQYTLDSMPGYLHRPNLVVLQAIDNETGKLMGVCNWGFRGILPHEMPTVEGRVQPEEPPKKPEEEKPKEEEEKKEEQKEEKEKEEKKEEEEEEGEGEGEEIKDPIKRLEALTNADMNRWMEEVMPEGTRCMFIVGLTVSPEFQGKGVGSALLQWGKDVCDEKGIFAWVHSSDPAWGMYQKSGFEVIQSLEVDLDKYAPCPPPGEGEGAIWGIYTFRYMKYFPKKK